MSLKMGGSPFLAGTDERKFAGAGRWPLHLLLHNDSHVVGRSSYIAIGQRIDAAHDDPKKRLHLQVESILYQRSDGGI